MNEVWISAIGLCGASLIGSLIGLFFKNLSHKAHDTIMGYCAGIMLAASVVGLILPAVEGAGTSGWCFRWYGAGRSRILARRP